MHKCIHTTIRIFSIQVEWFEKLNIGQEYLRNESIFHTNLKALLYGYLFYVIICKKCYTSSTGQL